MIDICISLEQDGRFFLVAWQPILFFLKPLTVKSECSAVFGDGTDDVVGGTGWQVSFDFEGDGDCCAGQGGKVSNDFFGDAACIGTDAQGVERDCAVEAFGLGGC